MKQLSNITISNLLKKSFSLTLIFIILITNISPLQVYAESPTPTPPPSDPTLKIVNDLSVPATESADQNTIQPSFEQMGPPSPQLAFTPPMFVLGLAKANFQAKEQIELTVKYSEKKDVSVSIEGADDTASVNINQEKVNGDTVFTLEPSAELKPGKYTVKVIDNTTSQVISEQNFTWGVLAINTNKSIYLPGETAKIAIAVLNEEGQMVCDARVQLEVTDPWGQKTSLSVGDGTISVNRECLLHEVTEKPDYETSYTTSSPGRYQMTLTAITPNGSYTTRDRFEVRDVVPFDVERITATRIYPPEHYPVRLKIHANEDFVGKIIESVPTAFQTSQLDEPGVIGYTDESPILANLQYEKDYGIPQLHLPFAGTYPVSQGFGEEVDDPLLRAVYKKSGLDGHDGIDFALPEKTPILAVDDGKVILAKENWIYGTSVVIQHSWGRTYYGHLSKITIAEGEHVAKGQQIGLSGSTGLATGPHLHFGLKPNDNDIYNLYFGKIDPSKYLGIASEDPVVNISDYPVATKALVWNVKIQKGADFVIGYQYLAPPKSPDFYTIGPLQFISSQKSPEEQAKFDVSNNPFVLGSATASATLTATDPATTPAADTKDRVIFQEIRPWQLAIDVSTTVILDANGDGTCGSGCWTVPSTWTNTNVIYTIGGGGAGDNLATGGGGGGGGAFARISNTSSLTASTNVTFNVGAGGTDGVNPGNTWLCSNTTSCANYIDTNVIVSAKGGITTTSAIAGPGGDTSGVGTIEFAGGAGGAGSSTGDDSTGGGGGAGSPYGTGGTGGAGDGTTAGDEGSGGGGGAGCDSIGATNDGVAGGADGGAGGASCFASGGAGGLSGGATDGSPGTLGSGGGGADEPNGVPGKDGGRGGDGLASLDPSLAGGGGGGGDDDTDAVNIDDAFGGNGGSYGGGGGGGQFLGTGAGGVIVITWTLTGPSLLSQLMRHGAWFSGQVEKTFTF